MLLHKNNYQKVWRIIAKILLLHVGKLKKTDFGMKVIKGAKNLRDLDEDGWYIVHQKGSHKKLKHPTKKGTVIFNGIPSTDFTGDLLKSIEKQSELVF